MNIYPIQTREEGFLVSKLAVQVFGPLSAMVVPKCPTWGYYIQNQDDEIVAGIILKKVSSNEGVIEWIFVNPKARGHQLGPLLLDAGIQALNKEGLIKQFALVRDDNTSSWNMFANKGFQVTSLFKLLFGYSKASFIYRFFLIFVISGYSFWIYDESLPRNTSLRPKFSLIKSILFALFIGAAVSLFSIKGLEYFYFGLIAVVGITCLRILFNYPFARLFGKVKFNHSQGGAIISIFEALILGIWWPHFGYFVPIEPIWKEKSFRKYKGMASFASWLSVIGGFVGLFYIFPESFQAGLKPFLIPILIYQALPFIPFEGMDGYRVFSWNKWFYLIGVALSIFVIFLF